MFAIYSWREPIRNFRRSRCTLIGCGQLRAVSVSVVHPRICRMIRYACITCDDLQQRLLSFQRWGKCFFLLGYEYCMLFSLSLSLFAWEGESEVLTDHLPCNTPYGYHCECMCLLETPNDIDTLQPTRRLRGSRGIRSASHHLFFVLVF